LKRKRISKLGLILVIIAIFLVNFGLGTIVGTQLKHGTVVSGVQSVFQSSRVNILFMGIDARANEINTRSDTMILASIDKKTNQAVLIWIPRDTRVEVSPGHFDKINSVNCLLGPEEAMQVTTKLLGTNVDYYVVTNFNGFADIIDIIGGVNIDVESNMYHSDPNPKLNINLSKGIQLLNGADALRYVRYRGGPTADIGRTGRQQKFIKALMQEMFSTQTISSLPELIPELMENVHTNMPLKEIVSMANLARNFSMENLITQTLPGYSFTDSNTGASYWHADEDITPGIIAALFAGETFEVISDPLNWTPPITSPAPQEEEIIEAESEESEDTAMEEDSIDNDGESDLENDLSVEEGQTEEMEESTAEDTYTGSEGYEPSLLIFTKTPWSFLMI